MTWPGLPRRRLDQVRRPGSPATAPGSSSVVRARFVIVSGPGDGVFVYAPGTTPGLGNPPIAWMGGGLVDPFGNILPSTTGVEGGGTFQAGTAITINQAGLFTSATGNEILMYFGAPAAGNLVMSLSTANAVDTDSKGNQVFPGYTEIRPGSTAGYVAMNLSDGVISWYQAATESALSGGFVMSMLASAENSGFSANGIPQVSGVIPADFYSLDRSVTSISTHSTGNVTAPTAITDAFTIDTQNGAVPLAFHTIKTFFNGTWGGQAMTVYADISGTFTALCTVGAVFASGVASGDSVNGWLELELEVITSTTCRLHIAGSIIDSTLNAGKLTNGTGAPVSSTVATGIAMAAGGTVAIAIEFAGSAAGQTIITEGARYTRRS
jgi:hypothetical protein